jgi:hypothetical protein
MRKKIKITTINYEYSGTKIIYGYTYDKSISKYFNAKDPFFVTYNEDVSSIPKSIAVIPFLANLIPIAWFAGFDIEVDELDEDFYNSLLAIKLEFNKNFAELESLKSQIKVDKLKKNRNSNQLENRKEKSEELNKKLVFNAAEDEMIKINSDDSIEISSEYKFITTDVIEEKYYQDAWNSIRRAFSGRQSLAYWRYPIFSKRGEQNKEPDITIVDKELGVIVLEILNIEYSKLIFYIIIFF